MLLFQEANFIVQVHPKKIMPTDHLSKRSEKLGTEPIDDFFPDAQ
jgi:hypothetical protein